MTGIAIRSTVEQPGCSAKSRTDFRDQLAFPSIVVQFHMDQLSDKIERALDLLRRLPADRQQLAADFIEDLAEPVEAYVLSSHERAICDAALAGPLASAAEVDDLLNKPW